MEVSMSITRRGKYTNSNICINVQVRNVVCLFFLLYANLLVLVTLCEGNHWRSLNFPWQAPEVLTKDGAYTIQEERDVRNAMQLCSESFDL